MSQTPSIRALQVVAVRIFISIIVAGTIGFAWERHLNTVRDTLRDSGVEMGYFVPEDTARNVTLGISVVVGLAFIIPIFLRKTPPVWVSNYLTYELIALLFFFVAINFFISPWPPIHATLAVRRAYHIWWTEVWPALMAGSFPGGFLCLFKKDLGFRKRDLTPPASS
jgi:hypothetical protein